MGQTRLLQKFRRFISLNAVLEHADAYIAYLQQNTTASDELAKFKKDLEEFKEEKIGDYELCLMSDDTKLEKKKLYIRKKDDHIAYTVITPNGEIARDIDIYSLSLPEPDKLHSIKEDVLAIASMHGHIQDDMDYIQFLNQQPKFKAFIQRPTIDHYARKLFDILKSKISDSQLSQLQNEYKEFLEQSHEDLGKDFLKFCKEKYYSLLDLDSMRSVQPYEKQAEFGRFERQFEYDINHLEYLLIELNEGHCFGFSVTDALVKDWTEWEKKIKNWSGKYSDVQPRKTSESKTNNDNTPEDLRGIISLAIQYVIPNHASRTSRAKISYMPTTILQEEFLKPQAHEITLPESKQLSLPEEKIIRSYLEISVFNKESKKYEIQSIQKYKLIAGDFSDTLSEVLDEKVIAGNICIIGPIDHACRLSVENGIWTFYDPNEDERITGDIDKIANVIIKKFGTSIDIKVASFDSKHDLVFSKYDKLLEDSPHLLLGKQGLHVMAKHSPDTLLELLKRARTDAKLCSSIATALTATVLGHGRMTSGFELILSNEISPQDNTLLIELLKLASTNADISREVAKALVQLTNKTEDFLDFTYIIVEHIDQLKVCFQHYPTVISSLSNFTDKNKDGFRSSRNYGILKAVCIAENINITCKKLYEHPENPILSSMLENNIENIKHYLPQHPSLIIELINLANSIKKKLPKESAMLTKAIANIIESKEMLEELLPQFDSNPSFIDNLFKLATSRENKEIKKSYSNCFQQKRLSVICSR